MGELGDLAPSRISCTAATRGLVWLMQVLATQLAPHWIRVNTIHPTGVATGMGLNDDMAQLFPAWTPRWRRCRTPRPSTCSSPRTLPTSWPGSCQTRLSSWPVWPFPSTQGSRSVLARDLRAGHADGVPLMAMSLMAMSLMAMSLTPSTFERTRPR